MLRFFYKNYLLEKNDYGSRSTGYHQQQQHHHHVTNFVLSICVWRKFYDNNDNSGIVINAYTLTTVVLILLNAVNSIYKELRGDWLTEGWIATMFYQKVDSNDTTGNDNMSSAAAFPTDFIDQSSWYRSMRIILHDIMSHSTCLLGPFPLPYPQIWIFNFRLGQLIVRIYNLIICRQNQ